MTDRDHSALLVGLLERLSDGQSPTGKRERLDELLSAPEPQSTEQPGAAEQTLGTGFVQRGKNALKAIGQVAPGTGGGQGQTAKPAVPAPVPGGKFPEDVERWRPLVAKYFAPNDVDKALYVLMRESSGDERAANPRSSARGLFQHLGRLWGGRTNQAGMTGADIFDAETNVYMAAWLLYVMGGAQGSGWSHWSPVYNYDTNQFITGLPYDFTTGGDPNWSLPQFGG